MVHTANEENQLTLAVLNLCGEMMTCGLYSDNGTLQNLVQPLVACLDGRSDEKYPIGGVRTGLYSGD